jgi:hypothetical protein
MAALLVVLILAGGLTYEYFIKPNQVLATVDGHQIKRKDYWKYQSVVLYQQARLYESYAAQSTGSQQSQFLSFAASLDAERADVWGTTDVVDTTVQDMVENQLYLDGAKSQGVDLSDADVQLFALNTFAPADTPLMTPVPTPTMSPKRAVAATETAVAALGGTPAASPVINGTPATGSASPVASPTVVATPNASPTPDPAQTADAQFTNFQNQVFGKAHMSLNDYYRLVAKPQLAKQKIDTQLQNATPQSQPQVHAYHILVATQDLAQQLYDKAKGGASFTELAKTNSTDTATAPTGGDLGWVVKSELDPADADAVFALDENGITQPTQTAYGWEVVKVVAKDPDRALTDTQYQNAQSKAVSDWLDQQRAATKIKTKYDVTPTATADTYAPPSGAPTVPPATPIPTVAPPVLGPAYVPPGGTPIPAATPIGPEGTPAASPIPASTPNGTATAAA